MYKYIYIFICIHMCIYILYAYIYVYIYMCDAAYSIIVHVCHEQTAVAVNNEATRVAEASLPNV